MHYAGIIILGSSKRQTPCNNVSPWNLSILEEVILFLLEDENSVSPGLFSVIPLYVEEVDPSSRCCTGLSLIVSRSLAPVVPKVKYCDDAPSHLF